MNEYKYQYTNWAPYAGGKSFLGVLRTNKPLPKLREYGSLWQDWEDLFLQLGLNISIHVDTGEFGPAYMHGTKEDADKLREYLR